MLYFSFDEKDTSNSGVCSDKIYRMRNCSLHYNSLGLHLYVCLCLATGRKRGLATFRVGSAPGIHCSKLACFETFCANQVLGQTLREESLHTCNSPVLFLYMKKGRSSRNSFHLSGASMNAFSWRNSFVGRYG